MGPIRDLFESEPDQEVIDQIIQELAALGLHYDYTVASTQSLADMLDLEVVRKSFMDALIEHVRTQPVTNTQYQLLNRVASIAAHRGT